MVFVLVANAAYIEKRQLIRADPNLESKMVSGIVSAALRYATAFIQFSGPLFRYNWPVCRLWPGCR